MSAMLPPEIGSILGEMFGDTASKEDNAWIADYVTFEEVERHSIMVSEPASRMKMWPDCWANPPVIIQRSKPDC